MTRKKCKNDRHCTRAIAEIQHGPVHAAHSESPAAADGEAAPVGLPQETQEVYSKLGIGGGKGQDSEQGSENYCSAEESSSTGTVFDAASKRSWYDGSEDSPEQTRASEQAPSEQSTSPEQLTLAPSTASQPVSPDGAAVHTACAADVAVRITFVADCKKRYTAKELRSHRNVQSPSADMAASLQSSGVPCHSFASACSVQLPREASDLLRGQSPSSCTEPPPASAAQQDAQPTQHSQQKRQIWKWVPWGTSQTSTQPAGRSLARAPSQQKAWGAAAQAAQQQDEWAIWREEFLQHSAARHGNIAGVELKKAGLLQQHSAPEPPPESRSREKPSANPRAAAAPLPSTAQREWPHTAPAHVPPCAEADLYPGLILGTPLYPDTHQQKWHSAPVAAAPPGAETGLSMAALLQQGTGLRAQPGATAAQAPRLGTVQRIALQTIQKLAAQDGAGPDQESGVALTLQMQGPVNLLPAATLPQPHTLLPGRAATQWRLQQPSGPPMTYQGRLPPLLSGGLLPFPPVWQPSIFSPLMPAGLPTWSISMYVPSSVWSPLPYGLYLQQSYGNTHMPPPQILPPVPW